MLKDEFSELEMQRLNKLNELREQGIEAYPTRSHKNSSNADAITAFEKAEAKGSSEDVNVILAGRLRAIRNMGKLSFAHIEDKSGKVQFLLRVDELGEEKMEEFVRFYDLGTSWSQRQDVERGEAK